MSLAFLFGKNGIHRPVRYSSRSLFQTFGLPLRERAVKKKGLLLLVVVVLPLLLKGPRTMVLAHRKHNALF